MYDLQSAVMTRAAELRDEGYDASEALSQAWDEVSGDGADGEDFELVEFKPRRRRSAADNPIVGGSLLLVLAGAYLAWCFFASTYKGLPWSWTPWRQPVARIKQLAEHKVIRPPSNDSREIVTLIVP